MAAFLVGGAALGVAAVDSLPLEARLHEINLPTVLRLAEARNLDIQIAREKLAEARAAHESSILQFLPSIAPGISYRRHDNLIQDVAGNIIDVRKQSYAPGFNFTARVDVGDAIYKELASRQSWRAAAHGLQAQREDSILSAVLAYFDLVKAEATIDATRETQAIFKNYYEQIRRAVEAGLAFRGDELRVKVQTDRTELLLRRAGEQRRQAAARLAQALHLSQETDFHPDARELVPLNLISTDAPLEALIEEAVKSRAEIRQSASQLAATRAAKKGATVGPLIPSLGAQAYVGGLGGGPSGAPDRFGESEDLALFLSWRLGPGGLFDLGKIHASKARLAAAQLADQKLREDIGRQVVEGREHFQSLSDQISILRQTLAAATSAQQLSEQRKEFAVGAVLEDIQTQQELALARSDLAAAIADFNKAQYSLLKALGRFSNLSAR